MRTIFKSLFISSALLATVQPSYSEQFPNFSGQPPAWNFGQTPIAWGDCIPVPIAPTPFGQNNIPMGQMGMNQAPIRLPMMQQFPMPMNEQPIAPPSPFFNNAISAPLAMPPVVTPDVQTACDDSALKALQLRYDQGAAASRAKIKEITQALNDSNNQMSDARVIIDNFAKKSEEANSKIGSKLSMLEMELTKSQNEKKSLQAKLVTAESNSGNQTRKINALNLSATELKALKSAYKERSDENVELKKKLTKMDSAYKTLQAQLSTAKINTGSQARKLTALNQASIELTGLKSAYKTRNEENAKLKELLTSLDSAHKSLQAQFSLATKDASTQARKLTVLSQSATELTAIQSAYKEKVNQNIALKTQLTELELLKKFSASCRAEVSDLGMNKDLSTKEVELTSKLTEATADTDNDGVPNNADKCPASPIGSQVNGNGCPNIKDTDADGVADESDFCAATTAGVSVNEFGCEPTQSITLKGVKFDIGSARLTPSSLPIITAAATTLNKSPDLNVEISGYTDNQGLNIINKRLSQRRANTVMIQLIKDGVDANRLKAKGYGEENPIADNTTAEGRATNRRVELKISN